ncbi:MAG: hypothetical protein IKT32_07440, partial [Clostridia bacterium]|nr:hypothetical protein [Clostridia bacterium]
MIAILTILYIFPFRLSPSGVLADELIASKVQNSVVLVTFESTGNAFASGFEKDLYAMYQTSDYSVKNYLALQSGNKMDFNTTMLYGENGQIVRSDYPVEYYRPRYEWVHSRYEEINQIGYDNRYFNQAGEPVSPYLSNVKISIDGTLREQKFIREIVDKISFNSNYSSDKNGDGLCDSLVIVTDCSLISSREDILWPHKGTAYTFTQSILNAFYSTGYESACALVTDKIVKDGRLSTYSLLSSKEITSKRLGDDNEKVKESEKDLYHLGLLTHETLHALGLADYYSYEDGTYESVGEFDLMGSTHVLPQNMLGYLRFKAGWLNYDDIL